MASIRTRGELAATGPDERRRVGTVTQRQHAYVASWRRRGRMSVLWERCPMASIRARGELAVIGPDELRRVETVTKRQHTDVASWRRRGAEAEGLLCLRRASVRAASCRWPIPTSCGESGRLTNGSRAHVASWRRGIWMVVRWGECPTASIRARGKLAATGPDELRRVGTVTKRQPTDVASCEVASLSEGVFLGTTLLNGEHPSARRAGGDPS